MQIIYILFDILYYVGLHCWRTW